MASKASTMNEFFKSKASLANASHSAVRFGNMRMADSWRDTWTSEGITNTAESRRNYLINKNNGYKVNSCFTVGKKPRDLLKIPPALSPSP